MAIRTHRRGGAAVLGIGLTMALAACGADQVDDAGSDATTGDAAAGSSAIDCAPYEEFADIDGESVTFYTSVVAPEDQPYIDAFKPFEDCTGVDVVYEGSKEFEAQLPVRVQSGNAPDTALIPQPGLLAQLVRDFDALAPAPEQVTAAVEQYYGEDFKAPGTVDGTFYAAPNSSNAKSFIWYDPAAFADAGYEVPATWDEMIALSDQVVADNPDGSVKPWCAGISSGDATGWVLTDWMEDVMLRTAGPDVYDQWVNHEIPFNDPQVAEALEYVGQILKNPDYVNGGLGEVTSIASTTFQDAGLPILEGTCLMHRQASFYAANWPDGTTVAEDGDVFAFPFPTINEEVGEVLLVGGEFIGAFNDRPATQAFQLYLTSPEFINARAAAGQFIPAHSELDTSVYESPIDSLSAELLSDENITRRFDASDVMPAAVGAGSFWTEMTSWIAEDKDDKAVLDAIEGSWPTS